MLMQNDPSEPLIMQTLEELARVSRRQDHADAKLYEELARQAKVKQGQLDLAHFCLTTPSGKAGNVITKALSKRNRKNWAGKSIIQCQRLTLEFQCPSLLIYILHSLLWATSTPVIFPQRLMGFSYLVNIPACLCIS